MKVRPHTLLLCLALLLGLCANAHAARRVALLIGNSQYQHETVLPNPVRDVALLERTLTELGFAVDKAVNLDKRGMELAINRFASKTAGADTALVFYAGHGTQPSKGGRSFLLPVNAQVTDDETLETDGVPADDIASKLERTSNPAKLRLVILDACRSRKTSRGTDRGLAPPKPTDDYTLIAYSTNDGETADDGKGANSPYAQALAKLLPRLTKEPVRQVFEDTAREVRATTNHKQKPRTYGDLESRIGLDGVKVASVGVEGTDRPLQADPEEEVWSAAKAANSAASYDAYLAEYSRGKFASAARIARASVATGPANTHAASTPSGQQTAQASQATQSSSTTSSGQVFKDCQQAHCPEMVVIPAGSFTMGSSDGGADERPTRSVNIRSFALGKYEVTQGQWLAVMGSNTSRFKSCGDNCPVEQVSWNDIQQFLQKLNQQTGQNYRLPSEAEWEYAARAGSTTHWSFGNDERMLSEHSWFDLNSSRQTHSVGGKLPNRFGLHDMHGSVWEWVQDWAHENYFGAPKDGSAWQTGGDPSKSVLRGGSWSSLPKNLRSATRFIVNPDIRYSDNGFRVARSVP